MLAVIQKFYLALPLSGFFNRARIAVAEAQKTIDELKVLTASRVSFKSSHAEKEFNKAIVDIYEYKEILNLYYYEENSLIK